MAGIHAQAAAVALVFIDLDDLAGNLCILPGGATGYFDLSQGGGKGVREGGPGGWHRAPLPSAVRVPVPGSGPFA